MARFERGYGYDHDHHPSAGGYRGRIGGYRGAVGGFRGADWGRGYDQGYRSRAQTDAGDPFGDRQSRTPIRVIRGDPPRGYDGGVWNPGLGYDHNFRHRYREYGYDRAYRGGRARGYDSGGGWFW
jgi:hypothetical protein